MWGRPETFLGALHTFSKEFSFLKMFNSRRSFSLSRTGEVAGFLPTGVPCGAKGGKEGRRQRSWARW